MTRNRMEKSNFLLVILWILLVSAGWVAAQEPEEKVGEVLTAANPEEVGEQASAALNKLMEIVEEARGYEEEMLSASAEDSLVFRLRLNKARENFITTLYQLADLVVASENDAEHHELRDRAEVVFAEVTPAIWELIDKLSTEIDLLRAQRMSKPPAERSALEDNIKLLTTRLDKYYQTGGDQVQKLDLLGQDTAEPKAVFAGLLSTRAGDLSGRIQLATLRINELGARLKEFPGDADIGALLLAARKDLDTCVTSQELVLNLMDALNLPTQGYRAELVTTTQDLASGLLDHRVASTLIKRAWDGMVDWVVTKGPGMLVQILLFLVILIAGRFLSKLVGKAVEKSMNRAKLNISQLLKRMIVNGVVNAVMGLAFLVALAQLGISLGPLLAGFGVIGFILGFAMQDSLSNLAAGMMILINRPYDVGDLVEISGVFGKVENMSMVSTSILTLDNQKLVVPNSKIWGDVIKNVTDQHVRRVDMVFGISYNDDIPNAERVLNEILDQHELVLNKPDSMVKVHTLGESSVDFVVRPWVKTEDYWDVYWDVTRTVKMRFDAEKISIPFPQRDVHLIPVQPDAPEEA